LFLPGFHSGRSCYFLYRSKHPRPISPSADQSPGLLISWFSSPLPTSAVRVPSHSLLPHTSVSCIKTTVRNQTTNRHANKQKNTVSHDTSLLLPNINPLGYSLYHQVQRYKFCIWLNQRRKSVCACVRVCLFVPAVTREVIRRREREVWA